MKKSCSKLQICGFTLIELTISLAIIAILTVVFLSQYPQTAVRLSLVNVTHTTALLIREAQVRGSAIDSANSSLGGYGVYFSLASTSQALLFGDLVDASVPKPYGINIGDGLFEAKPIDETKSIAIFPSGYIIKKLCVGTGFPFNCNTSNSPAVTSLTISFIRPNPEPVIYINNSTSTAYTAACIELRSPQAPNPGHIRNVQVFNSGMINTALGKCDNSSS